jgi:lysozyme
MPDVSSPRQKTGPNGFALIKHFESCRVKAFKPIPTDPWTIGWGRTKGVLAGDTCTQAQADAMLEEDLAVAEDDVIKGATVNLTQNQFDALVSFVYNCGGPAFWASTLRRLLNAGDFKGAAEQFPRWNKSAGVVLDGLTRRRDAEKRLFLTPDDKPFEVEA